MFDGVRCPRCRVMLVCRFVDELLECLLCGSTFRLLEREDEAEVTLLEETFEAAVYSLV